jgi:hypothetical protein
MDWTAFEFCDFHCFSGEKYKRENVVKNTREKML